MKRLAPLLLALLVLPPAWAAKADRQRPLVIQGGDGSALVSQTNERVEMQGPVTVTQGSLLLRAARLIAIRQPDNSNRLQASGVEGAPLHFSQNLDNPGETVDAQADELEYDERTGIARFIGRARVRMLSGQQLLRELSSSVIVFNTLTGELRSEGAGAAGPTTGGPRIVIMPKGASAPEPAKPGVQLQTSPALKPQ